MTTGRRWAPLFGSGALGLMLVGLIGPDMPGIVRAMTTPGTLLGPLNLLLLPTMVTGALTGLGATLQNYRRPPAERQTPPWLPFALVAVAGLALADGRGATSLSKGWAPAQLRTPLA